MPRPKQIIAIVLILVGSLWQAAHGLAEGPGEAKNLGAAEDSAVRIFDVPTNPTDLLLDFVLAMEQTEMDCSHLVHDLYGRVGLHYAYVDSITLYQGVSGFRRVAHPQAGDLIVWRGHVGIVVDPEEQTFVSALRTGVKRSSYVSRYWQRKGIPRFLHYVGTDSTI